MSIYLNRFEELLPRKNLNSIGNDVQMYKKNQSIIKIF